jgi:hypothetical protein
MSQNYLSNGFNKVRFGLHNDRGIFGACPGKMLHLVSLGWFKYCLEAFSAQAGGPTSLALKKYDSLCASLGKRLSRHSDCDLPRMNFPKGFSSGANLMGHEITGCLLVKLFVLHTTKFRQMFPPKKKPKKKPETEPAKKPARLRSPELCQSITRIEIPLHPQEDPKRCTDWQIIDVPSEVVHQLQSRNRLHFGQAHGTPFTVPPALVDLLGFSGDGDKSDNILRKGSEDYPDLDENVKLLLDHLKMTTEMAQLQSYPSITEEECVGKLKVRKVTTTTSPSGDHLGHYNALIAQHEYSQITDDDDTTENRVARVELRNELNMMQSEILNLHLQMINYALERGFTYSRWQTIANTMLFKDKGNIKTHRTHVIHIYKADYNLILGLKWRLALHQSEALNQLNSGPFRSRPRRNAIDPVMLEELQFEISRMSRKSMIQTNYDATACNDRIIPSLATLASRRFGIDKQVALFNSRTLENA